MYKPYKLKPLSRLQILALEKLSRAGRWEDANGLGISALTLKGLYHRHLVDTLNDLWILTPLGEHELDKLKREEASPFSLRLATEQGLLCTIDDLLNFTDATRANTILQHAIISRKDLTESVLIMVLSARQSEIVDSYISSRIFQIAIDNKSPAITEKVIAIAKKHWNLEVQREAEKL